MTQPILNQKLTHDQIEAALHQHHLWIASDRTEGEQLHLIGCDLSSIALHGAFNGRVLRHAILLDCKLDGVSITKCDLDDAVFDGSSFKGASLTACFARNASFSCCLLEGMQLFDNCFYKADFSHARLVRCDLSYCDAREAVFTGALIEAPIISQRPDLGYEPDDEAPPICTFAGADFRGAVLRRVHFLDNDITGAQFSAGAVYTTGLDW